MFVALVGMGAEPQWVLNDMRVSMCDIIIKAMARRRREEWEQARFMAVIGAQASGAKVKWDDLPNPYDINEEQAATESDVEVARKRLKELKKRYENESD